MTKVLYIGGWQRSGSTFIGNVLNEQQRIFHAGEICYLWTHKPWSKYRCGCGSPFNRCPVWSKVLEEAFGSLSVIESYQPRRPRSRDILMRIALGGKSTSRDDIEYLGVLKSLYAAISRVTECRVIVDSSKFPAHAFLLSQVPEIDLRMLHLIRDPRATAFSWQREVVRSDLYAGKTVLMPKYGVVASTLKWMLWNSEIELLSRRLRGGSCRLRYEDFVLTASASIKMILDYVEEPGLYRNVFLSDSAVRLGENHVIVGNPSRSRSGNVRINDDASWKSEMLAGSRTLVGMLTLPFLMRYGYVRERKGTWASKHSNRTD